MTTKKNNQTRFNGGGGKIIMAILIGIFLLFVSIQPALAQYGLKETATKAGLKDAPGAIKADSVAALIGNVVGAVLTFVGVLFLILMLYGGIIWMLARGNETETTKALNTIKAAIIGLIIVVASYAITTFVFQAIEGEGAKPGGGSAEACSDGAVCVTDSACPGGACWFTPVCLGTEYLCEIVGGDECDGGVECVNEGKCAC